MPDPSIYNYERRFKGNGDGSNKKPMSRKNIILCYVVVRLDMALYWCMNGAAGESTTLGKNVHYAIDMSESILSVSFVDGGSK